MTSTADYIYTRKNGGTTHCYGSVEDDSNYDLVCENELMDGIWAEGNPASPEFTFTNWREACIHLEKEYCSTIEQIIAC